MHLENKKVINDWCRCKFYINDYYIIWKVWQSVNSVKRYAARLTNIDCNCCSNCNLKNLHVRNWHMFSEMIKYLTKIYWLIFLNFSTIFCFCTFEISGSAELGVSIKKIVMLSKPVWKEKWKTLHKMKSLSVIKKTLNLCNHFIIVIILINVLCPI